MYNKIARFGFLIGVGLLVGCSRRAQSQVIYTYDFKFDALVISNSHGSLTFAAAEFLAESPTLLTQAGDKATVVPPGNLNGFAPSDVVVYIGSPGGLAFVSPNDFKFVVGSNGDVDDFYFTTGPTPGVGSYDTPNAGRGIVLDGFRFYAYTTGNLTISVRNVPEPGSTALLLGMGVTGAAFLRRRKNTCKAT